MWRRSEDAAEEVIGVTPLTSVATVMLLVAATMLVIGAGASALWIALVAVGIALVVLDRGHGRPRLRS